MSKPFDLKSWLPDQAAKFKQQWNRPITPDDVEAFRTALRKELPKGKLHSSTFCKLLGLEAPALTGWAKAAKDATDAIAALKAEKDREVAAAKKTKQTAKPYSQWTAKALIAEMAKIQRALNAKMGDGSVRDELNRKAHGE